MTKQTLSKSLLAIVFVLMASTVTRTFATTNAPSSHSILSVGDTTPGNPPDPTGTPGPTVF